MTDKNQSFSADWNWSDYFDNITDPPMRRTVRRALDVLGGGEGRLSIDIGSGHGNDTRHMLEHGFDVLAIDSSGDGLARLQARHQNTSQLSVQQARFEDADWPLNIWTNAGFALPFCPPDSFPVVWQHILERLLPGGVFSGQMFGTRDSWNGRVADMNFHSEQAIEKIIKDSDAKVLMHDIEETDGHDATGRSKHWHIHHLVIQRPFL